MIYLAGLSCKEIEELITPIPRFRAKQMYNWILRGVKRFDEMTDLPNSLRVDLSNKFKIYSSTIDSEHEDIDTKKLALKLYDGAKIEAVLLKDGKDRYTACLSTQVGCPAGCVFCKTGSLGFKRNLTCGEIIEQFLLLNFSVSSVSSVVKNIVIMGMGEPLLNLTELCKTISFLTDPMGPNFSKRRITVSTCGITEPLFDLAKNGPFIRIALSLTTADEELRQRLMPVTKTNPLQELKKGLQIFQENGGGRVTLEIPLLGGLNTRSTDAKACFEFAKGLDCVVNIIPWNPAAGLNLEGNSLLEPTKKEMKEFIKLLENYGLKVTIRYKKGRSINGACGQLGSR